MIEKVLDEILLVALKHIREEKTDLLTQEKSKKIIADQGKIEGQEKLIDIISLAFPDLGVRKAAEKFEMEMEQPLDLDGLEDKDIAEMIVSRDELQKSDGWKKVLDAINEKIESMKDHLIRFADASRDLFFSQGEYSGLKCYEEFFLTLTNQKVRRDKECEDREKETAMNLPFDKNDGVNMVPSKNSKKRKAEDIPGFGVEEKAEETL